MEKLLTSENVDSVKWPVHKRCTPPGQPGARPFVRVEARTASDAAADLHPRVRGHDPGRTTWNGSDTGLLDVPELDRLAAQAAGSPAHHLRAIQLPVSLVTAAALEQALDARGPIAQASRLGWSVFASAPLFGGELATLATRELADLINPELTIPQACLLATASCPGVTHTLLSASSPAHWAQARAALHGPPASLPTLRKVLDVLAAE